MPNPAPSAQRLSPQNAAQEVHTLCRHIPGWPYGAVGRNSALRLAAAALAQPQTARAGRELALYAWAEYPLDAQLLHIVRQLHKHHSAPVLPEMAPLLDYLVIRAGVENSAAKAEVNDAASDSGTGYRRTAAKVDAAHPYELLLQTRLQAGHLLHTAPAAPETLKALLALHKLLPALPPAASDRPAHPWALWLGTALAQHYSLHHDLTAARTALWPVWEHCPCHPNVLLALHELVFPLQAAATDAAPPALLLYSWNKAEVLAQTLHSLKKTEIEDCPIFVLDNGSSDDTATLLRGLGEEWGQSLHCLRLPVNIGAPAARNWLLSLPEVRQHDNLIFLDDDLLPERGWLHNLQAVAAAHPQADTIGCRITGHEAPYPTQCADFFLLPPDGGDTSFVDIKEHMHLHCAAMGSPAGLLTRYTRPCLSVSGCCHWLRRRSVESIGSFDIRFTPSQFDDAERDLRTHLRGGQVLYTGLTSMRHVQHSSLNQAHTRARAAHIFGNKLKLEFLYDAKITTQLRTKLEAESQRDLVRKMTRLAALAAAQPKDTP